MKKTVHLIISFILLFAGHATAQRALNPADTLVTYKPSSPPAQPPYGRIGKWVRTVRMTWDTKVFKAYVYKGLQFRLKFPKTYVDGVADGKKYPIFVFLHGRGEAGSIYDNEAQLATGAITFNKYSTTGPFDGYLVYGQTADGTWGNGQFDVLKELLDSLAVQVKGDLNRVIVNGLSAGGYGCWEFTIRYPQYIGGTMPMSGITSGDGDASVVNALKYKPIWYFQGGLDRAPAPYTANTVIDAFNAAGGNLTYSLYEDLGHNTWSRAWLEPDFVPYMNRVNILTPWPLNGRSEFCPNEAININVGIAPGFAAYEWQKDGVTIPGATTNSINVTSLGTYAVRVKRGTVWSEFSPTPLVIKTKAPTVTPPITIDSLDTNVLPAPDGSTTVTLKLPAGYASYEWRNVGSSATISTDLSINVGIGQYIARVTEQYGCSSSFSAPFPVINANGTEAPDKVNGVLVTPTSQTQLTLNWTDKPNPQHNETGFEIYRSTVSGSNYKLVGKTDADVLTFTDNGLSANTVYYYIIRPVNGNGAAPVSDEASGTTQVDAQKPSAPLNLTVVTTTTSAVSLSWSASTDNVGVTAYDVYVNDAKTYTVDGTTLKAVAYGLTPKTVYNFYVVARDAANNSSVPSSQLTAATVNKGLNYKYYQGTWFTIPNFATLTPVATGRTLFPDISARLREAAYGFLWEGYLTIPVTGTYTFATTSDDGSKFYFNQPYNHFATATVNNDGNHGAVTVSSSAMLLQKGVYPIAVTYTQVGSNQLMTLSWKCNELGVTSLTRIPDQYFGDTLAYPGTAPAAPLILGATAASFKQVNLSWTDNSNNETGFEIYSSPTYNGAYTVIGKTGANTTSFEDNTVSPATRYYYKIRAVGQMGESPLTEGYPYLAVWPFNNNYLDLSVNNNVASGSGTIFGSSSANKVEGTHSAFFNGTSAYMNIGGSGSGFLHDAFSARTVSLWIKASALDNNRIIFDIGGADNGLALRINANKLEAGVASGNSTALASAAFTSTAWTHVAVVYGGNTLRLYINGALAASATTSFSSVNATADNSRLGLSNGSNAFNTNGTYFSGFIDYMTIMGQALGQAEVTQAYNQTLPFYSVVTPGLPAPPAAPVNVIATGTSASSVLLTWTNNAANATGFEIQRALGNSTLFATIKTITTGGTNLSYQDTALYANQQYSYKVRATGDGGASAYSAADTAMTGNTRPVIDAISNRSARYDVVTTIPVVATDADEDALTYTTFNLPDFVTLVTNANGTYLNVAPNISKQGVYNNLSVIAADPFGGKDTVSFKLTINDNYSPVITSIANASLNEGDVQQLSLSAADQNATDNLSWSGVSLPSFITLTGSNRTATLNIKPGYADAGVYTVKVQIVDGNGGTDEKTFTVTVTDKNPNYKLFVRFKYQTDAPAPWNNITSVSTTGLKNDRGEATAIGMQMQTSNWFTWNDGTSTGNNSGVYPDVVMSEYYFFGSYPGIFTSANSIDVKLTGLEATRKYSFKFFAGSNWSVQANNGTTVFSINGVSKPLNVQGNTSQTVNFDNIAPNASGEITFNMSVADGTQVGYLGAFEVNAILDDGTLPAAPKNLAATEANGIVSLNWNNVAYNATGYRIHRGTDSLGSYSLLGSLNSSTATSYADSTVHGSTHYYYKVAASNSTGNSAFSNIAGVLVPVKPPQIGAIADVKLKANASAQFNVQAVGDQGNSVSMTTSGLPSFGGFTDNGNGTGSFSFNPTADNLGSYKVILTATDNQGASASDTFNVVVTDKNTTSVYFNFASSNPVAAPWNNITGFPYAGVKVANALDESGNGTGMSMTFNEFWENDNATTGMSTYDNSGVFPDGVMQSYVYDSRDMTHTIKLSGLNTSKRYNVVFFSSINFGINARARFTIGTDSVVIDPAYNSSLTKQINGVIPNASGEINILVNKTSNGYYKYLNAMVVESYDATLAVVNPLNLVATATSHKSIALRWSDRANNETGYQVWRALPGGSYSQIATLGANAVAYNDTTLSPNQTYYYKVRAVKSGVFSDYSNNSSATTPGFKILLNFNELKIAPSPWNNTSMRPTVGVVVSNMKDVQNNMTGVGINLIENFDGVYGAGMNTGNNSGIYPDNVMIENYGLFPGNHASFKVTGLSQTLKYDLTFFGSSVEWQDVTGKYTVNNTRVAYLNASMNKSGVVTIRDISPDEYGNILVAVDPASNSSIFGLIAALTITGHVDPVAQENSNNAVTNQNLVTVLTEPLINGLNTLLNTAPPPDFGDAKAYPNPFQEQINVDIQLKTETVVRVEIFDVSGRLLYSDYKGSIPAGPTTLRVNPGSRISVPGIYIMRLSGKNGESRTFKLVKR
ncbi:fibronectin type III domain-containing protein [Chitinophaga tropicalis]|nr:fibronectin type III domain-containing protein [Chitinophaga tropicalis]